MTPFLRRKLTYWSVGTDAAWLRLIGRAECCRSLGSADELVRGLLPALADAGNIYLSIDKDVFAEDVVKTNWDQASSGSAIPEPCLPPARQGDRCGCLR